MNKIMSGALFALLAAGAYALREGSRRTRHADEP